MCRRFKSRRCCDIILCCDLCMWLLHVSYVLCAR